MNKLCYCFESVKARGEVHGEIHLDEHSKCLEPINKKICGTCGYYPKVKK